MGDPTPNQELQRVIESAKRLGVELNEDEALQWLTAMAASSSGSDVVVDARAGVFGHKVSMLDFSPEQLAHYREIGRIVEFNDVPGIVETALALSGSAAQSKIQTYPGDCDYFERVNIIANTRDESYRILAKIMREKALSAVRGPNYQLLEVKFGSYPFDLMRGGQLKKSGTPITWTAAELTLGQFDAFRTEGSAITICWDDVASNPGWCKLDWVIADPLRGQLANASNVLDVTWQAPDGSITPLDGYLDPYFQEVYLDAGSVPIFSKLVKHVSPDALEHYITQLRGEIKKYLASDHLNYGKVAKRLYNIFRLTGRYEEAAFVRELFDEPATILYQVWSLLGTIDDCTKPDSTIPIEQVLTQIDHLIVEVVQALEGDRETEIVKRLLRLRDSLSHHATGQALDAQSEAARAEVIVVVNNFFYEKLAGHPTIKEFIDEFKT